MPDSSIVPDSLPHTKLETAQAVDQYLVDAWNIDFRSRADIRSLLRTAIPAPQYQQYEALVTERAYVYSSKQDRTHNDRKWYQFVADPLVLGPVHSERRTYILDACLLAHTLLEKLGSTGPVLDLGCNAGYLAAALARCNPHVDVYGVDACSAAIAVGQSKPELPTNLQLKALDFLAPLAQTFSFLVCVDSAPTKTPDLVAFLRWVGGLLQEGGQALFVFDPESAWKASPTQGALHTERLGYVMADVVGGHNGEGFGAKVALLLQKGLTQPIPSNYDQFAQRGWNNVSAL